MSRRRDTNTGDLLSWVPPKVDIGYDADVAGRGQLDNKIARIITRALRDAKDNKDLSRSVIAEKMAAYLGRRVSEDLLNKWTSEASDNRIPLDAFIALIDITGVDDLLGFVPKIFDCTVVPKKYASIIELHLLEKHEQEIATHKAKISLNLLGLK